MKNRRLAFLLAILVALSLLISSETSAIEMAGLGVDPCSTWLKWDVGQKNRSFEAMGYLSWVHGYLSGFSSALQVDLLAGSPDAFLIRWMDNYCRSFPSDPIYRAAGKLAEALLMKE